MNTDSSEENDFIECDDCDNAAYWCFFTICCEDTKYFCDDCYCRNGNPHFDCCDKSCNWERYNVNYEYFN